jgi:plastocyanin
MKALLALTGCCLLAAAVAVALGSRAEAQTGCQAGDRQIRISGLAYAEPSVTVAPGTTVCWTNQDGVEHTVTSDTGAFNSGNIPASGTFRQTFSADGSFRYHCEVPGHSMSAEIVVGAGGPPPPPPPPPPPAPAAQRVTGFRASVVRSGGRRWLVARARVTRAGRAQLRLQRRNRTVASARKQFRRGPNTLRLALRRSLPRGSYVARLSVTGARRPNTARIAIR